MKTTVKYKNYTVTRLSSGTIMVTYNDEVVPVTKPVLREIAQELGVSIYNQNDNEYNIRQLGRVIIKAIQDL